MHSGSNCTKSLFTKNTKKLEILIKLGLSRYENDLVNGDFQGIYLFNSFVYVQSIFQL